MAYVYRHIRLDKNEPFYIGVGTDENYSRANQKSKSKRNRFWHNIINITDYEVDILFDDIPIEDAFKKEIEFISLYGRKDLHTGTLVNLTAGGEAGWISFGDSNPMKRKKNRDKVSALRKGIKFSEAHKAKLSQIKKSQKVIPPSRKGCKMTKSSIDKSVNARMRKGIGRKIVYQYDINMNLVNTWTHGKEIKNNNPYYSIGNIHTVCRNKRGIAYGFYWSFIPLN